MCSLIHKIVHSFRRECSIDTLILKLHSGHSGTKAAQHCVQRTPLARPLTWARSFGVVAHRGSCRSVEVASGAADACRWAAQVHPCYMNTSPACTVQSRFSDESLDIEVVSDIELEHVQSHIALII